MKYTKEQIKENLKALGAPSGGIVLVHTAFSLVGEVEGGAQGLLDALIDIFTRDGGLLCIPTHTWANLGKDKITLDMMEPESNLGALPNLAARDLRGIRSENPTHSVVVFGDRERAEKFVENEINVKTPTSPESCYGKLYLQGGAVLLIGVAQDKNTFLHCVDEILEIPNRMSDVPCRVSVRRKSGEIVNKELTLFYTDYTNDISHRFIKYDTAFRYRKCVKSGFVGDAPSMLCDTVGMLESVKLILKNSGGCDPLEAEAPIPPKWYSK